MTKLLEQYLHVHLDTIAGWDEKDSSTFQTPYLACSETLEKTTSSNLLAGKKFGIPKVLKVTGNALNIEYYFWWRDYCFGLLIHHDAPFHFMVSISDEYKYKR